MTQTNTFSIKADQYASARPVYPKELYEWISSKCSPREAAWDCATGNGQAAQDLAPYFSKIYATDVSQQQVNNNFSKNNIQYSQSPAEKTIFEDNSFDLISVAQALHWFDYDKFWPEVIRTGKNGALFCSWGYSWFEFDENIKSDLINPFHKLIETFWAKNNQILWDGYQAEDVNFPFTPIEAPSFAINVNWSISELIDYLKTWSAYKLAMDNAHINKDLNALLESIIKSYSPDDRLNLSMPIFITAGYIKK